MWPSAVALKLVIFFKSLIFICFVFFFQIGDEIIAINGRKVEGLSHADVVLMFREVRRGAINITLGRKLPKDQNGLYVTAQQLSALTQMPYAQRGADN